MTDTVPTPSRSWKLMTAEQRIRAGVALWSEGEAKTEQRQAAEIIAKQKNFRLKTVLALDTERKARYLGSVPDLPEPLAARLLVVYHVAAQRPMMGAFLDALGIAHDHGMIHDENVTPDAAKIPAAIAAISKDYPAEDVALYLTTLLWQDPASWSTLADFIGKEGAAS
jgi:hypothetical protein